MSVTRILMPRIHGRPPHFPGSIVIRLRSSVFMMLLTTRQFNLHVALALARSERQAVEGLLVEIECDAHGKTVSPASERGKSRRLRRTRPRGNRRGPGCLLDDHCSHPRCVRVREFRVIRMGSHLRFVRSR